MNRPTPTASFTPRTGLPVVSGQTELLQSSGLLSEKAVDALADIAKRMNRLIPLLAERSRTDDGYRVIDHRTIIDTFLNVWEKAANDPQHLAAENARLWGDLAVLWQRTFFRFWLNTPAEPVIAPDPQDKRFKAEAWTENPAADCLKQAYLLFSRYCFSLIDGVKDLDPHTALKAKFYTRQFVSALSPANTVLTNPVVLHQTMTMRAENLLCGFKNFLEDLERGKGRLSMKMCDPKGFRFGDGLASSPGKVIYQNELMQLIQYAPTTDTVYRRPLLIVPPWINKFYILDLKPKNSFIRWCVEQGHTVFLISWVNPGPELAKKSFDDYFRDGPLAAIDAIEQATGEKDVNLIGYCIGGTLTAAALAQMAANGRTRVASATFFTTLLDFSDVGDISAFLDEGQLQLLDQHMQRLGYFEGHHMAEAFNLLRENELIWFFVINNYLLGRDPAAFDLLYWNSDSTRMPTAMHSFYLRNMYFKNRLKECGGITLAGVPIDLRKIQIPLYFLSTREDHIAPWRTTYLGAQLPSGPVRFVLGASGHVAGVINPPAAEKYGYWTNDRLASTPERWMETATFQKGSWWPDWARWVSSFAGETMAPRSPGAGGLKPIEDAPGAYVSMR
jgi:polyhydroxyalkanoate synthase